MSSMITDQIGRDEVSLPIKQKITISEKRRLANLWKKGKISIKSFCLRDRGRLGNEGQPILLKFGTQSRYVDLCSMPKF